MRATIHVTTMLVLAVGFVPPAVSQILPDPPDVSPVAELIERPTGDCNAAKLFLQAEERYRQTELGKPREERSLLAEDSPILKLVLQGMECRSCRFPYSADLEIPPWGQLIPMSALYWAAAGTFAARGEELLEANKLEEARQEFARAVVLGLLLYEEPGITFIQDILSLKTLSKGVEGLGDVAVARGDEAEAVICARFLARTQAYLAAGGRFIRQELPYGALLSDPASQAQQIQKISALYETTTNPALKLEMLTFLAYGRVMTEDSSSAEAAGRTLRGAAEDPDLRLRKLARWGLDLKPEQVRSQLRGMAGELPED